MGRFIQSKEKHNEGKAIMSDIKTTLSFDYQNDTNFNPPIPPYVPVGVDVLSPTNVDDMTNYFKSCGWIQAWGKELTGIDPSQLGGFAFVGDFLFMRKAVEFSENEFYSGMQFVKQIEVKSSLKNGGNAVSPVVIAMSIDGVKLAFLLHKTADPQTRILLGDPCQKSEFSLKNARVPFPANANWANHPRYQKGCKVSELSLAFNQTNIKIEIEVSESLSIGWLAIDKQGGSTITNMGHDAESINPTAFFAHSSMLDNMRTYQPNSAIAHMVTWGAEQGYITFDKEAEKVLKRKPKIDKKLALEEAQGIIMRVNLLRSPDKGRSHPSNSLCDSAAEWLRKYGTDLPFTTPDPTPISEDEIRNGL